MANETKIKEDTVTVPVAQSDLDAVSNAEFYNPHGVLGGHLGIGKHADTATIRVLRPLAKSVTILTQDGEYPMTHEYNGVFRGDQEAAHHSRLPRENRMGKRRRAHRG